MVVVLVIFLQLVVWLAYLDGLLLCGIALLDLLLHSFSVVLCDYRGRQETL